jgi:type II secretory pathway component PulF
MTNRIVPIAGGILLLVMLGVTGGGFYLVFVFPKMAAQWAAEGRKLSMPEMLLVNLSHFCSSYGLLVLPVLLLVLLLLVAWMLISFFRNTAAPAEQAC